ncbi:hypothetical protein TrRE_jg10010 [Triparma retinervis]|uniref:WW domain-containing protein n=1 Tax=Triparma retinervis TaxID=2557542 RepID=A0A9W7AHX0_9STRA|nr:hypothetical protein TrRE_jg10010 [Triparma retinervis]
MGVEANEVIGFQCAFWSLLESAIANPSASEVGVVFEQLPSSAVEALANDFKSLQGQSRLMDHLPELGRVKLSATPLTSPVGAVLLITSEKENPLTKPPPPPPSPLSESQSVSSLKSFVSRIVVRGACPYTDSTSIAATSIPGVTPGPVGYRYSSESNAAAVLKVFWENCLELYSTPESSLSTILLSLPSVAPWEDGPPGHARFAAIAELISRYLCFFKADSTFGLVHFHPRYDRDMIHPVNAPSYGNLPPLDWINPMIEHLGGDEVLAPEELELANYQRRSPHTMINILRASQLDAATGGKSIVKMKMGEDEVEASGINTYVRNARKMRDIGASELAGALSMEIAGKGREQHHEHQQQVAAEETTVQWTRYYSEEHSRHYLHNEKTGETRWE